MTRVPLGALAIVVAAACSGCTTAPTITLMALQIACDATTITEGSKATCTLKAIYSDNSTADETSAGDWASSNLSVATVAKGSVTAVTAGTADISAKFSNMSTVQTFVVRPGVR
jgi:hypothetical protein